MLRAQRRHIVSTDLHRCPIRRQAVASTTAPAGLAFAKIAMEAALTISITGDPSTPHQASLNLAKALNSSLLTAKGTTHHRRDGASA
ncbi:alpha/beta hydrolase [Streptomyces niveus]|uniref:alpha/beta hydrolase n=1 Tax=Streptomyces niveus TaxID=193462 RepID=UPI000B24A5C7|nr:alpha/beta hydrolase [Streptomyces niveus]